VKTKQGRLQYLYIERRSISTIRSRLRANRCNLGESLHSRALAATEECSHPGCHHAVESVQHALLHCVKPELVAARKTVRLQLREVGIHALTLEIMLGEAPHTSAITRANRTGKVARQVNTPSLISPSPVASAGVMTPTISASPSIRASIHAPSPHLALVRSVCQSGATCTSLGIPPTSPTHTSKRKSKYPPSHIHSLRITATYLRILQRNCTDGVL